MRGLIKAFILLLLMLVAMAGAVYIGDFVLDDPGFVLISYQGKAIKTSFAIFVIAIVLAFILLYIAFRLLMKTLASPAAARRAYNEHRKVKARKGLWRGLVDLAAGDWERAERALTNGASDSDMSLLHYLGAARAAQAQSQLERRDAYLRLAYEAEPDAHAAVALTRAEMQLGQGQVEQARATLADLLEHEPGNRRGLRMLYEILRQRGAWGELQELLPRFKRKHVLHDEEYQALEKNIYQGLLEAPENDSAETWQKIPRRYRTDAQFLLSYVDALVETDKAAEAETLLRKAINKQWEPALVERYGQLETEDSSAQLRCAEGWLSLNGEEPALLVALGRLNMREEIWGKARTYFEQALEQEPDAEVYTLLVECLNQLGETELAGRVSQQALTRLIAHGRGLQISSSPTA